MTRVLTAVALMSTAALALAGCSAVDATTPAASGQVAQAGPTPTSPATSSAPPRATPRPTKAAVTTQSPRPQASTPATRRSAASAAASSAAPKAKAAPRPQPSRSTAAAVAAGSYVDYATWNANRARYWANDVVLFFHASWCPKCRDTDASAKAGMPSGLTLVKIDYDNSTGLRQQYGVTLQHTFVQVGTTGNALKKWVGTYSDNSVAWVKAQTV